MSPLVTIVYRWKCWRLAILSSFCLRSHASRYVQQRVPRQRCDGARLESGQRGQEVVVLLVQLGPRVQQLLSLLRDVALGLEAECQEMLVL